MMNNKKMVWALLGVSAALSVACEPPVTTYRRSALTPSALGISAVAPLEDQEVELSGSVSHIDSHTQTPGVGDPALHVANTQAVGQLRVGLGQNWTLGGQLQVFHRGLSTPSADGTPPLADGLGWGVGPSASFHTDPWRGLTLGGSLAVTRVSVPWAAWELSQADQDRCPGEGCTGPQGQPSYDFRESDRDGQWLYRASLGPHYQLGPVGLFMGLSWQNSLRNIGFDDGERSGSTLTNGDEFATSYLGGSLELQDSLFLQYQAFVTHGQDFTAFQVGQQLTLGVRL